MGIFNLFNKKPIDGRVNNQPPPREIQLKGLQESAEIRQIKSETRKLAELVKYNNMKKKLEDALNDVPEDDELTKFMKMLEMAKGGLSMLPNAQTQNIVSSIPEVFPNTEQQQTLPPEPIDSEQENTSQFDIFAEKIDNLPQDKLNKLLNLIERM